MTKLMAISSRYQNYKEQVERIKNRGILYKARLIAEIDKDKALTRKAKGELIKAANEAKTEVKTSVFTEADKEEFRELGRFLGITPARKRKTATRRKCATARVRKAR